MYLIQVPNFGVTEHETVQEFSTLPLREVEHEKQKDQLWKPK